MAEKIKKRYAGVGVRFKAWILDLVLILPVILFLSLMVNRSLFAFTGGILIALSVSVYLFVVRLKKYGGSPGKRLLKIKVVKPSGEKIGWKEAVLRNGIPYIFSLFSAGVFFYTMFAWHISLIGTPASVFLAAYADKPKTGAADYLALIWFAADAASLLADKKHRSLKDLIAGTVAVYD